MADVTTPMSGRQFRVSTSATEGGTYTLIGKMTGVTKTASTTTETTQTFEDENAYSDPGTNEVTASIDGLFVADDAGQVAIRDAKAAGSTVYLKFLPYAGGGDTTNDGRGFTWPVKIGSTRYGAVAAGGAQTWGFDAVSQGDEVEVVDGAAAGFVF
jgi:hypothetical protein